MLSKISGYLIYILCCAVINAQANDKPLLTIDVPFIELHSGAGIGYPILYIIEQGEQVSVLVKRTSWFKVEDKRGNKGWFHQDALLDFSQSGEKVSINETQIDDYKKRVWEGGVMYGDLEGKNFYNLSMGYAFSPQISTELSIGKALGNISDSDLFEVMLFSQPFPSLMISPYFGVGAGLINTQPHSVLADAKHRENTLMSTAVGAKYYLTRNFLLRIEYKYSMVLTNQDNNEEMQTWKLGFSVFF